MKTAWSWPSSPLELYGSSVGPGCDMNVLCACTSVNHQPRPRMCAAFTTPDDSQVPGRSVARRVDTRDRRQRARLDVVDEHPAVDVTERRLAILLEHHLAACRVHVVRVREIVTVVAVEYELQRRLRRIGLVHVELIDPSALGTRQLAGVGEVVPALDRPVERGVQP